MKVPTTSMIISDHLSMIADSDTQCIRQQLWMCNLIFCGVDLPFTHTRCCLLTARSQHRKETRMTEREFSGGAPSTRPELTLAALCSIKCLEPESCHIDSCHWLEIESIIYVHRKSSFSKAGYNDAHLMDVFSN